MDCLDVHLSLHALLGASLVLAGANLMMHSGSVIRGYGAYCFALGYLILGLCAAGHHLGDVELRSRRYLLGVASAVAVVVGTFMTYYHLQERVHALVVKSENGEDVTDADVASDVPMLDHVLVYGGMAGLVLTAALHDNGHVDYVKGGLVAGALAVIGYTKNSMLRAVVSGENVERSQTAHILSWGLLVLALAYRC